MKKPFDLNYYIEHPEVKVVTRAGRGVRILCTDLKNDIDHCVAAAFIKSDGNEGLGFYTPNGCFLSNRCESDEDLFFDLPDPAKKKVPLTYEDLLARVKSGKTMWISGNPDFYMKHIVGFNKYNIDMLGAIDDPSVEKFLYQELIVYSFIDGTPCWKEVEE